MLKPALLSGIDTAKPSGKFCIPIPSPRATAEPSEKIEAKSCVANAPKATPTAKPSGMLCIAIANTSKDVFLRSVFGPSASSILPKI